MLIVRRAPSQQLLPVPVSGTDCGELGTSSAMVMFATRWPAPRGEKATLIVHETFGAKGPLQVLAVNMKSPGLAPLRRTEEICSVAPPALVTVMLCAALTLPCAVVTNVRLPGVSVTAGWGAVPLPVSGTACGLPGALSLTVSDACRRPGPAGEKTMLIVQVLFGDRTVGMEQLGIAANSEAFTPVSVRELRLRPWSPVSVKVTSREPLDCPTVMLPKFSEAGKRAATGPLSA